MKIKCSRCKKRTNNNYTFGQNSLIQARTLKLCPRCRRWALTRLFTDEHLGQANFTDIYLNARYKK